MKNLRTRTMNRRSSRNRCSCPLEQEQHLSPKQNNTENNNSSSLLSLVFAFVTAYSIITTCTASTSPATTTNSMYAAAFSPSVVTSRTTRFSRVSIDTSNDGIPQEQLRQQQQRNGHSSALMATTSRSRVKEKSSSRSAVVVSRAQPVLRPKKPIQRRNKRNKLSSSETTTTRIDLNGFDDRINEELKRLVAQGHVESSRIVQHNQQEGLAKTQAQPAEKRKRSIPAFASKPPARSSTTNRSRTQPRMDPSLLGVAEEAGTVEGVESDSQAVSASTAPPSQSPTAVNAPPSPSQRYHNINHPSKSSYIKNNNNKQAQQSAPSQTPQAFTGNTFNSNNNYPDIDLQRYYRTDLLSMEEEYIYGERVQFMIACEDVHEGLALKLSRLPTLGEWAAACGYTEPPPTLPRKRHGGGKPRKNNSLNPLVSTTEEDEQLRPSGWDKMFEEVDPNLFVGNGLIGDAGPGRGRGRAKKIPRARVKDRRADHLIPPRSHTNNNNNEGSTTLSSTAAASLRRKGSAAVNRGTVRDFLTVIQTGREAKQMMVQNNMRLVVSIARKYMNVGVNLNDLVQEGSLGLSRAAEKFDPRKGFKFSTYASWWIQQAVFRCIAYQSRNIRLPVHIHNLLNRIHRERKILTKDYGRAPTNEEMATQLGMSLHKYNKLLRLTKRSISLDIAKYMSNPKDFGHEGEDRLGDTIDAASVQGGGSGVGVTAVGANGAGSASGGGSGFFFDESCSPPERMVDHTLFLDDLRDMIQILNPEERKVLCARYGLTDGITRTVTAVAHQMKQSKAWVRSQECRALRKLRRPWYEKKLKEHEKSLNGY